MKRYQAPWSLSLVVVTVLVSVVCLSVTAFNATDLAGMRFGTWRFWRALLPAVLVVGAALFTIRGYTVTPDAILVHRLLWATRLPRAGLRSATLAPQALRGAIRTFGNGGLYSASGWFRSPALSRFRAYVTDARRAVVLRYPDRTVVVSPGDADGFVHELSADERPA